MTDHRRAQAPADPAAARLADFIANARLGDAPSEPMHQAKRLLLSRLWASACAAVQPEHHDWLRTTAALAPWPDGSTAGARIWWLDRPSTPAAAADLNQRLCRLQPHAATHLPTATALGPDLLPQLMATAEGAGLGGRALLQAWAIGIEVALAQAAAGSPQGDLGAVAAQARLQGRAGAALAADLHAAAGGDAAALAAVARALPGPRQPWRLQSLLLHTRPVAAVSLAPVEAVLRLRARLPDALPRSLCVAVSPAAWPLAEAGDVAHAVTAAWWCGQYTLDESRPALRLTAALKALRDCTVLCCDAALEDLAQAEVQVGLEDGRVEHERVLGLLGAPDEPLSDAELAELFRQVADDLVLPRRAGEILAAVWGLDRLDHVGRLTRLLVRLA